MSPYSWLTMSGLSRDDRDGARATGRRGVAERSAESALETLQNSSVGVIIADIAMPRIDGYELMRGLRASGNRIPSIAVTAFARSG